MEYKFKEKWNEDTDISWWKVSRKKLNKIIEIYNNWQIQENFDKEKARFVLANIEYGKQTFASSDEGSGYRDELIEMEEFVRDCLNRE